MTDVYTYLKSRVQASLEVIYQGILGEDLLEPLAVELLTIMRLEDASEAAQPYRNHWNQSDVIMITYGDSFLAEEERPLHTLKRFLDEHSDGVINGVHILPFFPFSSDDGFAVKDFFAVRDDLGDWEDIKSIAADYRLMGDLVINHGSSEGVWFQNFLHGKDPGRGYFFEASPEDDLADVVRPRTSPLLKEVETAEGKRHVWCTFSHDQVDFDFRNPEVLKAFVRIVRHYLDNGVNVFRMDAVAFLWKLAGTTSLNLPQTHEAVRLLRVLIEHACDNAVIITETNIPSRENLSYFGNANEAHCVYNFSLPPLLVYTLTSGNQKYLKQWMMSMPPAQDGTAYFNFIASHDGIGLRPVEGLLKDEEVARLIRTMQSFGGRVSWRALTNGVNKPYEINISLFDALKGTEAGVDNLGEARFICAHTIMLALEGIPGIYVHSLLATENDHARVEKTGHNRSINRHQWDFAELEQKLADTDSHHTRIFSEIKRLLKLRIRQPAFHPNATQFTLHLGEQLFGFWRQSINRNQSIFCISNISNQPATLQLTDVNLISIDEWQDLITGEEFSPDQTSVELAPYQTVWITNGRH